MKDIRVNTISLNHRQSEWNEASLRSKPFECTLFIWKVEAHHIYKRP